MKSNPNSLISRRTFLAALIVSTLTRSAAGQTPEAPGPATEDPFVFPEPITIHESIQVLDWRPFPSPDMPRFIAEIKNTGYETIDAPGIGLLFPNDQSPIQFAWGNPWHVTIAPGQSTFIHGTLDIENFGQEALDSAEWVLCHHQLTRTLAQRFVTSSLEWTDVDVRVHDTWGEIDAALTNHSDQSVRWFAITGMLRDSAGRVAGGSFRFNVSEIQPHETREFRMYVQHYDIETNWVSDNPANPYHILEPGEHWTIELAVDARGNSVNTGCPAVMPWNRDD